MLFLFIKTAAKLKIVDPSAKPVTATIPNTHLPAAFII